MRIPWRKSATEAMADALRFAVWSGFVAGVIAASVFAAWFSTRFFWQLSGCCVRRWFQDDW